MIIIKHRQFYHVFKVVANAVFDQSGNVLPALQQVLADINHLEGDLQHDDTIASKSDLDELHRHADEVTDLGFALLRIAEGFRGWAHDAERDPANARNVTWEGPRLSTATAAAANTALPSDQDKSRKQVEEILDDVEDMMYAVEDVNGDDLYDSFDELLEDIRSLHALATKIELAREPRPGVSWTGFGGSV